MLGRTDGLLDLLGVILVLPSDKSETIPSSRLHLSNLFRASSTVTLNGSASSCQLFRYPPRRREDESRRPCGLHASTTALPPLSPWKGRAVRRVGGSRSSRRPAILLIGPFHPTVCLCAAVSVSGYHTYLHENSSPTRGAPDPSTTTTTTTIHTRMSVSGGHFYLFEKKEER